MLFGLWQESAANAPSVSIGLLQQARTSHSYSWWFWQSILWPFWQRNGKLKGHISFLQCFSYSFSGKSRIRWEYNTVSNLSHVPPSPRAATLPLAVQERLSKLSKALKDAITCFSLVWCRFSRASCSTTCSTKARQVLRKQSGFLSPVAIGSVCIHPTHMLHPTFSVVDVNPVPLLSLQSQMGSIYF